LFQYFQHKGLDVSEEVIVSAEINPITMFDGGLSLIQIKFLGTSPTSGAANVTKMKAIVAAIEDLDSEINRNPKDFTELRITNLALFDYWITPLIYYPPRALLLWKRWFDGPEHSNGGVVDTIDNEIDETHIGLFLFHFIACPYWPVFKMTTNAGFSELMAGSALAKFVIQVTFFLLTISDIARFMEFLSTPGWKEKALLIIEQLKWIVISLIHAWVLYSSASYNFMGADIRISAIYFLLLPIGALYKLLRRELVSSGNGIVPIVVKTCKKLGFGSLKGFFATLSLFTVFCSVFILKDTDGDNDIDFSDIIRAFVNDGGKINFANISAAAIFATIFSIQALSISFGVMLGREEHELDRLNIIGLEEISFEFETFDKLARICPTKDDLKAHPDNLGCGSFGNVWKSRSHPYGGYQGVVVAVKQPIVNGNSSAAEIMRDLEAESRFFSTFRHPNIVSLLGVCLSPSNPLMVLELCLGALKVNGDNAHVYLQESKLNIIRDLAAGLQYLHSRNVIHLDLKLANIMVGMDGRIKITDFGISRNEHFVMPAVSGTLLYMAPEQGESMTGRPLIGSAITKAADIFAFGCISAEIICRKYIYCSDKGDMIMSTRNFNRFDTDCESVGPMKATLNYKTSSSGKSPLADDIYDDVTTASRYRKVPVTPFTAAIRIAQAPAVAPANHTFRALTGTELSTEMKVCRDIATNITFPCLKKIPNERPSSSEVFKIVCEFISMQSS
jgi:serine/threonine protein kinase